jgi:hypothetical protein
MDPREELRSLVAGFRVHLEARQRSGLLGVPARQRVTAAGSGRPAAERVDVPREAVPACRRCGRSWATASAAG